MDKNLFNFYLNDQVQINAFNFIESVLLAAILCTLIQFVYLKFSTSLSNKLDFSKIFIILGITTTLVITIVKSSLALSLGLVGALSIVRFRHPVKSALELIIYFDLITIGIAASVKNNHAILLISMTVIILLSLKFLQKYKLKSQGKSIYNMSFNEGIEFNQIEILSSSKIMIIEDNENLKSVVQQPGTKEYLYRLIFEDKKSLRDFKKSIEGIKTIKKIDVNYL